MASDGEIEEVSVHMIDGIYYCCGTLDLLESLLLV